MIFRLVACCAIAALLGFLAGGKHWQTRHEASLFEAATKAQTQTAKDIRQSLETSEQIEQAVAASTQNVTSVRVLAAKRQQEKRHAQQGVDENQVRLPETDRGAARQDDAGSEARVCGPHLDLGTVWLLDAAIANQPFDAARLDDAESQAASAVGADEATDHHFQVIELYHELSIRHNGLVDYVQQQIDKQAK